MRGIGGRYDRIAPGNPTGFNPLALPDSPANRAFLRDWLGVLLKAEGPEELATISDAVDAAYANDARLRRLRHFRELLAGARRPQPGDLADRLVRLDRRDGEHGWLFDNAQDRLDLSQRVLGFDMTALLDNPRLRTPVMMYLFHRIDERLDGQPTMILIDEGWKALDDEVFAARIRDWLKTLRKRNALVGFATQSCARCARKPYLHRAGRADRDDDLHAQRPRAGRGLLRRLRPDRSRTGADPHRCRRTAAASWCASPTPRWWCGSTCPARPRC